MEHYVMYVTIIGEYLSLCNELLVTWLWKVIYVNLWYSNMGTRWTCLRETPRTNFRKIYINLPLTLLNVEMPDKDNITLYVVHKKNKIIALKVHLSIVSLKCHCTEFFSDFSRNKTSCTWSKRDFPSWNAGYSDMLLH